jgi:hypothetical protein
MSKAGKNRLSNLLLNKEEANMLNTKSLFALALLVPLVGAAIPAQAAKQNATAARAACFKQANAAAAALGGASSTPTGERQSAGYDAYATCCRKAGIRP